MTDAFATQAAAADRQLAEMKAAYEASPGVRIDRAQAELQRLEGDPYHANKALTDTSAQMNLSKLRAQIAIAQDEIRRADGAARLNPVDLAMSGVVPDNYVEGGVGAPLRDQVAAVPDLRAAGFSDQAIRDLLSDRPVEPMEREAVVQLQKRRLADPAWCAKLLANDPDTVRESMLMSAVLAAEIKQ